MAQWSRALALIEGLSLVPSIRVGLRGHLYTHGIHIHINRK